MNHQNDREIINSILAGDASAYSILVNRYGNRVFTLAYNIILSREDAEEVAQDAFVRAFKGLSSFKHQAAFSTWLYRIVVNAALNKKKLRPFSAVDIEEETISEVEQQLSPLLQRCVGADQQKYIQLAMRALRAEERICITLFYLNELPVAEIEELTGITAGNIKVLLHRGREAFVQPFTRITERGNKRFIIKGMEEDENLKALLSRWAIMDTPAHFTAGVMQRVAPAPAGKPAIAPLLKDRLMKVLIGVFLLVCIILIALCIITRPAVLPFTIKVKLSSQYSSQIISFLIVFWVVMIGNGLMNKRRMQVV